jgi:transcriptional regulator with XRE-family HTH domain
MIGDIEGELKRAIKAWPGAARRLCLRAGISPAQVSYFMRGRRSLTLRTAARLCRVLGLHLAPKGARTRRAKP